PIMSPATRAGASLVMALRPTGLKQSSPMVWSRYVTTSQSGLTLTPVAASCAATIRIANPAATNTSPITNFRGLDGSRLPSDTQSQANNGDSSTMQIGLADWNQLAGKERPNKRLSVLRSAKRFRVEPACSNTDQKIAAPTKSTR